MLNRVLSRFLRNRSFTVTQLTVVEYSRRKVFMVILFMMLGVAGTSLLFNPSSIGFQSRLMRDLALLFIELFSVGFALALSATSIPNEMERKSLYTVLAKPITRGEYLWGKFLAIAFCIFAAVIVLGLELLILVAVSTREFHPMVPVACLMIGLESVVVSAIAIWLSTFMTPAVTFTSVLLLYVIGSISHVYTLTLTTGNPIMGWCMLRLKSLIPYFDYFSIRSAVTHDHPVSSIYLLSVTLYGIAYILVAMLFSEISFLRKDL